MENKGIDCTSMMCGCNNVKTGNTTYPYGIRDPKVTFDQFIDIMGAKILE